MGRAWLILGLIATTCGLAGEAQATARRTVHHRRPAAHHAVLKRKPVVPAGPAHHMSALALQAQQQRLALADPGRFAVDNRPLALRWREGRADAAIGGIRRTHGIADVEQPAILPNNDGAVGLSLKFRTH